MEPIHAVDSEAPFLTVHFRFDRLVRWEPGHYKKGLTLMERKQNREGHIIKTNQTFLTIFQTIQGSYFRTDSLEETMTDLKTDIGMDGGPGGVY